MFSFLIKLIFVVLVATAVVATAYPERFSFVKGAAAAQAARLLAEAQTLTDADERYAADIGEYAPTFQALLSRGYLSATPAFSGWEVVAPGANVFVYNQVDADVCAALNFAVYKQAGILRSARTAFYAQCYGLDASQLNVVVAGSGEALTYASTALDATVALGPVLSELLPVKTAVGIAETDWYHAPHLTRAAVGWFDPVGPLTLHYVAFNNLTALTPDPLVGGVPNYLGVLPEDGTISFTNHTGAVLRYGHSAKSFATNEFTICTAGATCVVRNESLGSGTADWPYMGDIGTKVLSIWATTEAPNSINNFNLLLSVSEGSHSN